MTDPTTAQASGLDGWRISIRGEGRSSRTFVHKGPFEDNPYSYGDNFVYLGEHVPYDPSKRLIKILNDLEAKLARVTAERDDYKYGAGWACQLCNCLFIMPKDVDPGTDCPGCGGGARIVAVADMVNELTALKDSAVAKKVAYADACLEYDAALQAWDKQPPGLTPEEQAPYARRIHQAGERQRATYDALTTPATEANAGGTQHE